MAQDTACIIKGDPHYLTFDGLKYDHMGNCSYAVVAWCGGTFATRPWQVISVRTKEINPKRPGHTRIVGVILRRFGTGHFTEVIAPDCSVKLNGRNMDLESQPFRNFPNHGSIERVGEFIVVESFNQYRAVFDCEKKRLDIFITYEGAAGNLCGLCGNYNGDASEADEFQGHGSLDALAEAFRSPDPDLQ
uniref:IgGFc-binding protein-like n=1 Tax=Saccoglossus kowalevskii TaxID=10224 RepID=A0ABM0M4A8_SACKO|nr:PREDICTED: IgGFc-binding protein-like [Saccoglossus kowalevskii]